MKKNDSLFLIATVIICTCILTPAAAAKEIKTFDLKIKDHRFEPEQLEVPAGEKFKLRVENLDNTPEEFESYELNREKLIPANGKVQIYISSLKAGEYPFMGEFNQDTAQGKLIAV